MNATTIGLAEAKKNFSRATAEVSRTGKPVTVLRNNRPWVTISPAAGIAKPDMVYRSRRLHGRVRRRLRRAFQVNGFP